MITLELTLDQVNEVLSGLENTMSDRCGSEEELNKVQSVLDVITKQVVHQEWV